jgi:hypothetical protein
MPTALRQVQRLFCTSREDTAVETILKLALGPLAVWAGLYSLLPWLLS